MLHWFCHHCQLVSPRVSSSLCSPRCSVLPPVPDSRAILHIPSSLTCWLHLTSAWPLSKGDFFFLSVPFRMWPILALYSVFLSAPCQIPCSGPLISKTRTLPVPCSPDPLGKGIPGLINLVPCQTSAPMHGLNFSSSLTFPEILASVIFQCFLLSAGTPSQLPFGLPPGHPPGLSLDGMTSGWTSLIFAHSVPLREHPPL